MPTPEQQKAFGDALRSLMDAHGDTQKEFGERIAEGIRGVDKPYAQSTVRDWITKSAPDPEIVFYMEGYLLVPPGTLSQHLGYLPLGARSVVTVEEALMNDTSIGTGGRDILLILYSLYAGQPLVHATLDYMTTKDLERLVASAGAPMPTQAHTKMQFDDKGRLISGFDQASVDELLKALKDWAQYPNLPTPKALLGALAQRRNDADRGGVGTFGSTVEAIDAALAAHANLTDEQFAAAADTGKAKGGPAKKRKPRPKPEPNE